MENEKMNELLNLEQNAVDKAMEVADVIEKEVAFDFEKHIDDNKPSAVVAEVQEEKPKKKKLKKIDLSKISVVDSNAIEKENDIRHALYGGKSAFQIVAAQSGYMAKVSPLVNKDVINLLYSNLSRYEYRKSVYKVIYDKIIAISSCNMTFEGWLKATSVEDIETFYYGVYCATFPNQGTFSFMCPNCGNEETLKIEHNNLVKTANKTKMKNLIREVSTNAITQEAMQKYSLVGKTEAFQLSDSRIIVELRTPSLWDSLEILRVVPESVIDRDTTSVTNMLYVKRFLIPSKNADGYTEQLDHQEVLRIIDNLTLDDANDLQEAISERVDDNRISYSIKNIKCPRCANEIKETPISIEDILFTLIFEKASL